jgi:hypothetical protein
VTRERTPGTPDPDLLYQQHVKPLEDEYQGHYALVTPKGLTFIGTTLLEVAKHASEKPNRKYFVFKIGTKFVGKIG